MSFLLKEICKVIGIMIMLLTPFAINYCIIVVALNLICWGLIINMEKWHLLALALGIFLFTIKAKFANRS